MTHDYEGGDSRREGDRKQEPSSFAVAITRSIHLGNGTATPLVLLHLNYTEGRERGRKEGGKREDGALVAQQSHASLVLFVLLSRVTL